MELNFKREKQEKNKRLNQANFMQKYLQKRL